ncbi:MAG: Mth938-like domain-containing protein [Candidatus Marinimicrobia bacterium]|nr:Mth938-like domain-containing protein [Candidatus Neomarinimicrobiota bacterium]MCF7830280.1 Mth938-like domain-containing protein [Candidatus Neomarinimicrobiota bacterium]MCF7882189.1 Mth938-like domain-containing protein [Candidatus Neomarinimicrobiota bacterium]
MTNNKSPRITGISWGKCEVEGAGQYKDAKLWPGGSRAWDWNETGTSHSPGVQQADVEELVEHGAQKIILTRGQTGRLKVQQSTIDWLNEQGVETQIMKTKTAVKEYNMLAESEPVGALIHSTC